MKVEITRSALLDKILFVSKTVIPKTTNYILNGMVLEAEENLNLLCTDLETSIKSQIEAKILKKGRVVVPYKVLLNILRNFPEAKVNLEYVEEKNLLHINCENSNFSLNTLPIEEYPQFPEINKKNTFNIEVEKFKYITSKVQKSCSTDESRMILTGILVDVDKGNLKMVSTDSYRLSLVEESIKYEGENIKVVVPSRVLDNIVKSEFPKGDIEINTEENQISFIIKEKSGGETTIISRLLTGRFPEYEKLLPKDFKHSIVIDKAKTLEVIRRISSISQDNIPLKLIIGGGKINVSMNIREVGSSSEDLEVAYGEEEIQIAFNPQFLIDGLSVMDGEKIIFSIVEPLKPVLLKPEKKDKSIYLLMPIRVS